MSDDDSDSDDDLLLGSGPMFGRAKSRQAKASETRMLGFLDECLRSEGARSDRRDRIASMIREEEEEEEEEEDEGGKQGGDGEDGGNGEGGEGNRKLDGGAAGGGAADGKECDGTTPMTSSSNADGKNLATASSRPSGVTTASSSSGPVPPPQTKKKKKKKFDIDDPSYWTKIEEAARGAEARLAGRAKRRREIDDAVDGLDELSDTDGEDGSSSDGGGEGGESREQKRRRRRALASAAATGRSTCLGVRSMFGARTSCSADRENVDPSSSSSSSSSAIVRTFATPGIACAALDSTLKTLIKTAARGGTAPRTKTERDVRDRVLRPLKAAVDGGSLMLAECLTRGTLVRACVGNNGSGGADVSAAPAVLPVPGEVMLWLWDAACSGRRLGLLSDGACQTLTKAMESKVEIDCKEEEVKQEPGTEDVGGSSSTDRRRRGSVRVADLVPALEGRFGLWTGNGPAPAPTTSNNTTSPPFNDGTMGSVTTASTKKPKYTMASSLDDISGLQHFLTLWAAALDHGYASWDCDDDGAVVFHTAARCVAVLSRAGIDPAFHMGRDVLTDPLSNLIMSLTEATVQLLESDEYSAAEIGKTNMSTDEWFRTTAESIIDVCSDLTSGPTGAADDDDAKGWLPLSLAVRLFPTEDDSGGQSLACVRLKAVLAEKSLRKCLDGWHGWDDRIQKVAVENRKRVEKLQQDRVPARWQAMTAAEVALHGIERVGDAITRDGPRFLASVEIAGICAELGMALFADVGPSADGTGGLYGSIEEADAMSQSLESLENLCSQLKKCITSVFVYPHLRRVKELLTLLAVEFRHKKVGASELAQHKGEPNLKQKTLCGWINDDENSQEASQETTSQEDTFAE